MAEAGRWKPYVQRQGQLLPAFVEDARASASFRPSPRARSRPRGRPNPRQDAAAAPARHGRRRRRARRGHAARAARNAYDAVSGRVRVRGRASSAPSSIATAGSWRVALAWTLAAPAGCHPRGAGKRNIPTASSGTARTRVSSCRRGWRISRAAAEGRARPHRHSRARRAVAACRLPRNPDSCARVLTYVVLRATGECPRARPSGHGSARSNATRVATR
jgi:hypothetical protein